MIRVLEHSDHPRMNGQAPARSSSALCQLSLDRLDLIFSGSPNYILSSPLLTCPGQVMFYG